MVFRLYCVIYRGNKIDHLPYVPLELKCEILKPGYVPQREFCSFQNVSSKKGFGCNHFEHGIVEFWERSFHTNA